MAKGKHRKPLAIAAFFRSGAGTHHDRRAPRGGTRNLLKDHAGDLPVWTPPPGRLWVLLPTQQGLQPLGTLRREGEEYIFAYFPEVKSLVFAFPDRHVEYRSRELWPFFASRIPPLGREDVQEWLRNSGLSEADTLEILGTLCARSIANPYVFEFEFPPE